jgi:hypothetical protein
MKNILIVTFLAFVVWKIYDNKNVQVAEPAHPVNAIITSVAPKISSPLISRSFTCDGRQHCSQMTSCQEATYFIQYCPDTKMDGDGDGVPCERQWCR